MVESFLAQLFPVDCGTFLVIYIHANVVKKIFRLPDHILNVFFFVARVDIVHVRLTWCWKSAQFVGLFHPSDPWVKSLDEGNR